MFDVSFSELMVIAVVALVVIGPERLPKVARTVGHLLGRLQRYVTTVKADINREMQLEELKRLQQQVSDQVRSVESSMAGVTHEIREMETSLNQTIAPPESAVATVPPASTPDAPAAPAVASTPAPQTAAPAADTKGPA